MLVVRRLGILAFTAVAAPSLCFLLFEGLRMDPFSAGTLLADYRAFISAYVLHGDLGRTEQFDESVTAVIREGMAADIVMLLGGLAFALVAGLGAGLVALARPRRAVLRGLDLATGLALSLPVYWLGFVVLMLVASGSGLVVQLPFVSGAGEYEALPSDPLAFVRALWVPCVVVGLPTAAGVYRMTVAAAREVLGEDFVRTARGKGLRESRVLLRHVLPVAGIPVSILAASQVNLLITNVCLMQSAFNIPGSFRYLVANTANADLSMLYGLIVWGCLLIALANFAVDVLQSRLDPRVGAAMRRG